MKTMNTLVRRFFDDYIRNNLGNAAYLSNDISIDYTTLGRISGRERVTEALSFKGEYNISYNILSNTLEYEHDDKEIVITNAFHFLIKTKEAYNVSSATSQLKGEILYFVYGGKYKFTVSDNLITNIRFNLEAEYGNTYWAKQRGWKLFEETKGEYPVKVDDYELSKQSCAEDQIREAIFGLLLISDTNQKELLYKYATDDALFCYRDSTYPGMGVGEDERVRLSMLDFVANNKSLEDQNHHSCRITGITVNGDTAVANLDMFEPTKLGFKHLDSQTIYQPYYNETWKVTLQRKNGWKISNIDKKAVSKFQTVGYATLEI